MSQKSSPTKTSNGGANPVPGSAQCPFKLAIIGGGPAGCSVVIRALRIGVIAELCNFTFRRQQADGTSVPSSPSKESGFSNVNTEGSLSDKTPSPDNASVANTIAVSGDDVPAAVVDPPASSPSCPASPTRTTTTLPSSPMRLVAKQAGVCLIDAGPLSRLGGGRLQDYVINSNTWIAKFVTNVTEEKPDNLPPESVKGTALEALSNLASSKALEKMGNKTGPLHQVGTFLRDVGQISYQVLNQYPDSSKCYLETKVTKLQKVVDEHGKFLMWKISMSTGDNPVVNPPVEVYATHVLLSTGGHQEVPKFTNPLYNAKVVSSDDVCTEEGVADLKKRLSKAVTNPNNPSRIAIIGGSHSAFSAAWICLHRVEDEEEKKVVATSDTIASAKKALMPGQEPFVPGRIRFGTSSICLLYRSAVKVFYATKAEADHDNYNDSSICVNKITGQINPFGGIRGDAKDLWRMIRSSREPRVRMLQVKSTLGLASANSSNATNSSSSAASNPAAPNTANGSFGSMKQSIVDKILDEATVIVWACGYVSNLFPIVDAKGKDINLSVSKGQVDVDDQCRVLQDDEFRFGTNIVIENLYGSGLGYGLKATLDNGEADGSSGRADGVAVYLKRGATLVLAHVVGNRVYGGNNITSWETRNKLLRKQNLMNQSMEREQREREVSDKLAVSVPDSPTRPGTMASPSGKRVSTAHSPTRRNPTPAHSNNQDTTVREQAKSAPGACQSPYLNRVSKPAAGQQGRPNSAGRSGRLTSTSSTTPSTTTTPSRPTASTTATTTPQTGDASQLSKSASGVALPLKTALQNNAAVSASAPNTPNSKSNHNSTYSSHAQQLGKTLPVRGTKGDEINKMKSHVPIPTGNKATSKSQASSHVNNKPASQANAVVLKPKPFPLPDIL